MNILFFGGHYWDRGAWFRKQQFALRLSQKGHKVFYVEESPSIIRRKKGDKNFFFKTFYKKINENLYIITPSSIFPFPSNSFTRHLYNKKLFFDIKRIFKRENIRDYILWTNKIELSTLFDKIQNIKIIDICDDLPLYQKLAGDEKGYKSVMKFFVTTLSKADITIVSAQKIKEKYGYLAKKEIIVIPNGHNITFNNKDFNIPEDILEVPHPRIGFVGTLFQFIDEELLSHLIENRPNFNFIFIGDVDGSFPIEKIKNYNNVFLLGKKNKELIPNYISALDVCLNPFKVHEVNDSVNPLKVFEYLALKKPVISTIMYSLMKEDIAAYINFAKDYKDYLNILDFHVVNKIFINNIPEQVINNYNWDNLFHKMLFKINDFHQLNLF